MAEVKITDDDKKKLIKLYNDGYGTLKLAKIFDVDRMTIQRHLKKSGLDLRKKAPNTIYDVNFFNVQNKEYNKENCYWAGFILADGCIRSDRDAVEIGLAAIDKTHLEKFQKAIQHGGNIRYDKHSDAFRINVAGKWFVKDLSDNFGIHPKKSLTAFFPIEIPKEQWAHFVRGIFDGDGCITFTTCLTINFTGTAELLRSLQEIFYYILDIRLKSKNKFPPIQQKENVGQISYSGKNALLILDWLYQHSNNDIRLDRKYELYKNGTTK